MTRPPAKKQKDTRESPSGSPPTTSPGRYAYEGLDRVLHERARLSILTSLMTHGNGLLFNDLKQLCTLTDGNLSRHLDVLGSAGLVEIWRGSQGGRPQTLCRLTSQGRERFIEYLAELERVVRDAVPGKAEGKSSVASRAPRLGWSPA